MKKYLMTNDVLLDQKVKIQGTDYDRSRKVTKQMLSAMKQMIKMGDSYASIANKFGVTASTVRYNLDKRYKNYVNSTRDNYARNNNQGYTTLQDRAAYKRSLIEKGII